MAVRRGAFAGWQLIVGTGLILLAACGGDTGKTAAPERTPTRTLLPATLTPDLQASASPSIPTPTDLPGPLNLSPAATAIRIETIPPAAQAMIDRAMDDLAAQGIAHSDLRLLSLEAFTWRDRWLGCTSRRDASPSPTLMTRGYRIVIGADSRVYVYHTDQRDTFFVCEDPNWLALDGGEPIPVDPIMQSMAELAVRDAATQWNVPQARVRLATLLAVHWPDSSLGCPKPNGIYEEQSMPGYRIVLRMEAETAIYHASIRSLVRCAPEEEILPGVLRAALATSTPEPTAPQ
jgi:hypothetical protein